MQQCSGTTSLIHFSDNRNNHRRFHTPPNNVFNSCRLLTAVLLWHAEVLHNGRQQHRRKLQSGRPRQFHASQNWNHGSGGQAGSTTTAAAQTQTSRHERFNTFWLLTSVQKFHFSPTSSQSFFFPFPQVNLLFGLPLSPPLPLFLPGPSP